MHRSCRYPLVQDQCFEHDRLNAPNMAVYKTRRSPAGASYSAIWRGCRPSRLATEISKPLTPSRILSPGIVSWLVKMMNNALSRKMAMALSRADRLNVASAPHEQCENADTQDRIRIKDKNRRTGIDTLTRAGERMR